MKRSHRVLACLLVSLPFFIQAQSFNAKNILPKSLSKYSFGMSLDNFTDKNKLATPIGNSSSFRIEYQDMAPAKDIKKVTYYFDAENSKPLYEMIIEFNDLKSLETHCSQKLGNPNDGKQWKRTTKEGYTFKAWRFSNTLVYAVGLPSTEWEKGWDN
jgi:hypothetical protein